LAGVHGNAAKAACQKAPARFLTISQNFMIKRYMKLAQIMGKILPRNGRTKVFCVGYNKTGTTSIERMFKDLGYRCPDQVMQESQVVKALYRGDFQPLKTLCENHDAFQDLPFSKESTYAQVDCMFPGSKFILTVRDPKAWFESLTKFHLRTILKDAGVTKLSDVNEMTFKDKAIGLHENYLYHASKRHAAVVVDYKIHYDWSLLYDAAHRIDEYESRNREIIKYFQYRPEQLLVIDLKTVKDTSKIIEFLGLSQALITKMPHLNKSAD
jgi:hypothetical protein